MGKERREDPAGWGADGVKWKWCGPWFGSRSFQWFIMTGLAKGMPRVVRNKAGVVQGPSQGDLHGARRDCSLLGRRAELLNYFIQGSGAICILARLFPGCCEMRVLLGQ